MITLMNKEELLSKFLGQIRVKPENTKKLFSIGFIATTGVGKSTVSKEIANRLGLFVGSNDQIRRFLNNEGFPGIFPDQDTLQFIAEEASKYLYKNKISHVIDADLVQYHMRAKENAEMNGARFFLIHLVCPKNIIMEHLKERDKKILLAGVRGDLSNAGHSLSSLKEYQERTRIHESTPLPNYLFMTIDTSKPLDPQISELERRLMIEGVI